MRTEVGDNPMLFVGFSRTETRAGYFGPDSEVEFKAGRCVLRTEVGDTPRPFVGFSRTETRANYFGPGIGAGFTTGRSRLTAEVLDNPWLLRDLFGPKPVWSSSAWALVWGLPLVGELLSMEIGGNPMLFVGFSRTETRAVYFGPDSEVEFKAGRCVLRTEVVDTPRPFVGFSRTETRANYYGAGHGEEFNTGSSVLKTEGRV